MTRADHLEWAKKRALAYLQRGDLRNAVASMMSDLSKHEELGCSTVLGLVAFAYIRDGDMDGVKRWIEGFN